jgi:hypothetical protein
MHDLDSVIPANGIASTRPSQQSGDQGGRFVREFMDEPMRPFRLFDENGVGPEGAGPARGLAEIVAGVHDARG